MRLIISLILISGLISIYGADLPDLKTTNPEVRSITRESRQPGELTALYSANLGARISGYVDELFSDIGDPVKRGDVLARIHAPELAAEVKIAQAEQTRLEMVVRSAEANLRAVLAEDVRIQELVKGKSLSEKVALESENKLASARAGLASAEAEMEIAAARLEAAEAHLSFTEILAPFDGTVAARNVELGDLVHPEGSSEALFVIEDRSVLRLVTYVPERDAVLVNVGDPVRIKMEAYPGKLLSSKISRTSKSMGIGSAHRMRIEAEIANIDGMLPSGLYCSAIILLEKKEEALVIPAEAVRFGEDPVCVYVIENGVLKHRPVELGVDEGPWIEVVSGLTGSDSIVTGTLGRYADGTPVTQR